MKVVLAASLASLLVLISAIALAQSSGGEFQIVKSTIDNGGGTSTGGEFSLTGTIGQHDANPQKSTGGVYALAGGFWANAKIIELIFRDGFENN